MKYLLPSAVLLTVSVAFANPSDREPSNDSVAPSRVEKVYALQAETASQPAIRLIKVDNGGSSDISALMAPSTLYLAIHKDGEMFDVDGQYVVSDAVDLVQEVKLTGDRITLTYTNKDERLKVQTQRVTLLIGEALREAKKPDCSEESGPCQLKSTIGIQAIH